MRDYCKEATRDIDFLTKKLVEMGICEKGEAEEFFQHNCLDEKNGEMHTWHKATWNTKTFEIECYGKIYVFEMPV